MKRWPYTPAPTPGRFYRLRYWWWLTTYKPVKADLEYQRMLAAGFSDYEARADAYPK